MSIGRYLKDRIVFLLFYFGVALFVAMVLSVFRVSTYGIIFISLLYVLAFLSYIGFEYFMKYHFYKNVINHLEGLDKKYLLAEMLEKPFFYEGELLYQCLQESNKSMNDEISKYVIASKEYREYIELWIHEVKTPVASSRLIIENHNSEVTKSIGEEIDSIDDYLEQVLFYSRSNTVEKDYIIKEVSLKTIVFSVMRKNAKRFIREKVQHQIEELDIKVHTDEKWMTYILHQVVGNAMKYRKEDAKIEIYGVERENAVLLVVKDNGIGISKKDLPKVFEKGFTGSTGRVYTKSTGMGLYLAKKLCDKMGLLIEISSEEGIGTSVIFTFPKNRYTIEIR